MVLLAPRDTTELREMTLWMADFDTHPSAVRYPRGAGDDRLPEARTPIVLGEAEVLCRAAVDSEEPIAICAVGSMVSVAWEARAELAKLGIDATVINARFLKPFDATTICEAAQASGRLVTIEENAQAGGFGQTVRTALHDAGLGHIPHTILAIPDRFIEQGAVAKIREDCGLSTHNLVIEALKLIGSPSRE
jgi:1-deoxy-D-xylulose-5-phosphate synthase